MCITNPLKISDFQGNLLHMLLFSQKCAFYFSILRIKKGLSHVQQPLTASSANAANGTHMTTMNAAVSRASRRVLKVVFCMLFLLFIKYLSKAFCRQVPQAHRLTGAVDTDIYPTPPLGMRAVNQRLLFPLKKEIQKP